ncbi:copper oxidase [Halovivax cerinus]|uniref:Copper oxidase n=1 Tax=Halovivax cerinus TaxID=1487865 RepID=A0ABD5NPC7_9EURY|nr:copper oxidase [Halovivax cerinus]
MTQADVFELIFQVFLGLGTLVGIVVVLYIMYNAYAYKDEDGVADPKADSRPTVGELPVGGKGGKKLFLSFGLSAIIVLSLIIWTYGMLLFVEQGPGGIGQGGDVQVQNQEEVDEYVDLQVYASAFSFSYNHEYQGNTVENEFDQLVVPADVPVSVNATSRDVWHTFGISEFRVKADAIPGENSHTWFEAEEPGYYDTGVQCYELCGRGHSGMNHDLIVVSEDLYTTAIESQATGDLFGAIQNGDLSVDSTPAEFEEYMAAQESDDGGNGDGTDGGNNESTSDGGNTDGSNGNESTTDDGGNNESGGDN